MDKKDLQDKIFKIKYGFDKDYQRFIVAFIVGNILTAVFWFTFFTLLLK